MDHNFELNNCIAYQIHNKVTIDLTDTLLPHIQVHALIYVAKAKVHALKWIQIYNFLEVRKIHVLRIYLYSSIWRVVLDILVKSSLLLEEYKRKKT